MVGLVWIWNNTMQRHMKVKETYYTHESQKREAHHTMPCHKQGTTQEEGHGSELSKADGEKRDWGSVGKCLYWESGWGTQAKR